VRLSVTLCVAMAAVRVFAGPLHLAIQEWPPSSWLTSWYGPGYFGVRRAEVAAELGKLPGKQLAIVRYSPKHNVFDEWVYNDADLDDSKVIWAREMDIADNKALLRYYGDRKAWLVQPDSEIARVTAYPAQQQGSASLNKVTQ
jgi:hypothetical protein